MKQFLIAFAALSFAANTSTAQNVVTATVSPTPTTSASATPGTATVDDVVVTSQERDVVNLFDRVYELRSGSGIGVFAPQFGERRGFYGTVAYDF